MCEGRVQNGRRWLAVVTKGCVSLGHQPLQAVGHVGRLRALCFCRERHQKENCTIRKNDRAVQKIEGPNAMLEHKLSADTFLDCNLT